MIYDVKTAEKLRVKFQLLTKEERKTYLSSLNKLHLKQLMMFPRVFLFDKQVIDGNDWTYCILRCGRRFGKGRAGAAWIAEKVYQGAKKLGICGPTYDDVSKVMVPYILDCFPKGEATYNHATHTIHYKKAEIYCFTSDKEVRGYSLEYTWCDEVCQWADGIPEKIELRFKSLKTATSKGKNPQMIITSTPKPFSLFFQWEEEIRTKNPAYKLMTGTIFDNPYLSEEYIASEVASYGDTPLGRQELYGDLIESVAGALWTPKLIEDNKITIDEFNKLLDGTDTVKPLVLSRVILSADPAISNNANSDETGLVVMALSGSTVYIINDSSGRYNPNEWAKKSNELYSEYQCDMVVAEKNQGGQLVEANIKTYNKYMNVKLIHASAKKIERAELPASMYHRGRVKHVGTFKELEWQMTHFTGDKCGFSPDRLDALCHGINELTAQKTQIPRNFNNLPTRG